MSSPQQCSDSDFNLRSSLWECRDQDLFTDISLVCNRGQNQQIIRGHKIIFAASSTYLSKKMSQQALDLPDVDFRVLQDLVKFIYTGQAPISEPEFENFVELGGKLSVKGIPNFKINTDPSDLAENEAALPEENPRDRKRRTDGVEQSGSTSFEPDVNPLGASTNDSEESNFFQPTEWSFVENLLLRANIRPGNHLSKHNVKAHTYGLDADCSGIGNRLEQRIRKSFQF